MKSFLLSLAFLTTIPAGGLRELSPGEPARAVPFFPVVGLLLGAVLFAVARVSALVLPSPVPEALVVAALCGLTGCLHLDGLADSADGLFGAHSGKLPLEIMKDSRVGVFGVCAVALVLIVKFAALSGLKGYFTPVLVFPVLGRWAAVVGLSLGRPAATSGLGAAFSAKTGLRELLLGGAVALVLSILLGGRAGLAGFVAVTALSLLLVLFYQRRVGGITGDLLGSMIEVSELLALIIFAGFS